MGVGGGGGGGGNGRRGVGGVLARRVGETVEGVATLLFRDALEIKYREVDPR